MYLISVKFCLIAWILVLAGDDEPVVSAKIARVVSRLVNRWVSLAGVRQ